MFRIAALYKFTPLDDIAGLRARLVEAGDRLGIGGVLLLASEGINGTVAGAPSALGAFLDAIRADQRLSDLSWKESWAARAPFRRLRVRLKKEIVSMGAPDIVRPETVGEYVAPEDWNALISRDGVAVVDTRNDYEVAIGRFEGAIDPQTARFRDFPAWAETATALQGAQEVAMYCTGGIRCEKASALMRSLGCARVYHLEGGILAYLERVPEAQSLWRGDCFVFDERVSVSHGLRPGGYGLCRGCRRPVGEADRRHPLYEEGVRCAACAAETSEAQLQARRERRRQMALAAARGEAHLAGVGETGAPGEDL